MGEVDADPPAIINTVASTLGRMPARSRGDQNVQARQAQCAWRAHVRHRSHPGDSRRMPCFAVICRSSRRPARVCSAPPPDGGEGPTTGPAWEVGRVRGILGLPKGGRGLARRLVATCGRSSRAERRWRGRAARPAALAFRPRGFPAGEAGGVRGILGPPKGGRGLARRQVAGGGRGAGHLGPGGEGSRSYGQAAGGGRGGPCGDRRGRPRPRSKRLSICGRAARP